MGYADRHLRRCALEREELFKPAWDCDRLDSNEPPEVEAPYFDAVLGAWVLSRYVDVLAAFRSSGLAPSGAHNEGQEPVDENARLEMRAETLEALSSVQLRGWRERLESEAHQMVDGFSDGQTVDLMEEYARPLCLSLAAMVTGISLQDAERLQEKAREVSAASAEPYDACLRARAKSANTKLQRCFHSGPAALRDAGFVALSQTMPCILGNAWYALIQQPREWLLLHRHSELMEQAMEELLRYAGLVRILFRRATEDVDVNGVFIRRGERVILRIIPANRDPERFFDANEIYVTRRSGGHLALGAGSHSCVGASLIRMAAVAITYPLVKRFAVAIPVGFVDWQGGSGFRSPVSLRIRLNGG
jgi:cytochrome P450